MTNVSARISTAGASLLEVYLPRIKIEILQNNLSQCIISREYHILHFVHLSKTDWCFFFCFFFTIFFFLSNEVFLRVSMIEFYETCFRMSLGSSNRTHKSSRSSVKISTNLE